MQNNFLLNFFPFVEYILNFFIIERHLLKYAAYKIIDKFLS